MVKENNIKFEKVLKESDSSSVIEADKLMPNLSDEPIVWTKVSETQANGYYFGIRVFTKELKV
jgi:hypothetical protein